jgi:hypothetical protein
MEAESTSDILHFFNQTEMMENVHYMCQLTVRYIKIPHTYLEQIKCYKTSYTVYIKLIGRPLY